MFLLKTFYHAETVNYIADNAAVIDEVVQSGDGNETDLSRSWWDPDVIVFSPGEYLWYSGRRPGLGKCAGNPEWCIL